MYYFLSAIEGASGTTIQSLIAGNSISSQLPTLMYYFLSAKVLFLFRFEASRAMI